jgi:ribosomal protein S2
MLAAQGKSHSTYTNLRYDGGALTTFQTIKCTIGFKLNTAVMADGNG